MRDVAWIIEFVGFSLLAKEEAKIHLSKFADLSAVEKDAARSSVIETIFPLAFGENAVIEGSANLEELLNYPW